VSIPNGNEQDFEVDRRPRIALAAVAVVVAVATIAAMWFLWPRGGIRATGAYRAVVRPQPTYRAAVVSATSEPCTTVGSPQMPSCLSDRIRLGSGPDTGRVVKLQFPDVPSSPKLRVGDPVFVARVPVAAVGPPYYYVDRDRSHVLWVLVGAFLGLVLLLGRWRGLMALIGLGCSIGILLVFVLPAILSGRDPVVVAIVASSAIAFLALYLAQGFSAVTTVALLGTLGGLAVAIVAAQLAVFAARFTGFSTEEAFLVSLGASNVDLSGLVLAGIIIGALGAIDDMTVTQASTVAELLAASPEMSRRQTFRSAMRVGRDHVASTVNTLVLAYAGASLPLLLLFLVTHRSWGSVISGEAVAVEIVRTLAGSLGLVAAVPITTALAALSLGAKERWVYDGIDLLADER